MWAVFLITTTVAGPLQDGLEAFIAGPVSDAVRSILPDHWLVTGLLVDGLIGGVGMVLTFAPLLALMFLCLAVLEDSGYMARAAVVTDRVMRAIGLPGKAFIPIGVGYGCNVPAISATRVLGDVRHRILTCLLISFTSCSARLIVFMMLAQVFSRSCWFLGIRHVRAVYRARGVGGPGFAPHGVTGHAVRSPRYRPSGLSAAYV